MVLMRQLYLRRAPLKRLLKRAKPIITALAEDQIISHSAMVLTKEPNLVQLNSHMMVVRKDWKKM
jgi:hypothetical protein